MNNQNNRKNKKSIFVICFAVITAVSILILAISFAYGRREGNEADSETSSQIKNKDICNFLLLGKDKTSGLTDVIMLVSVDTKESKANIVQVPRDTYAEYSDGSYKKLNGAVSALGGAAKLCGFIEENMGVDIDGYFLFGLDAFVKAVDAVGGVEVDVPFDLDYTDPEQNLSIHLKAGRQVLDGKNAEKFVRYRSGYIRGDLGRIDAQKIFMSAFIKKVSEAVTPTTLVKIVASVFGDIRTNLTLKDLTDLAVTALKIKAENINMITLCGQDIRASSSGAWYYVISRRGTIDILSEYMHSAVSDTSFDKGRVFLNENYDSFEAIYESDIPYDVSSASDINENGLKIEKK